MAQAICKHSVEAALLYPRCEAVEVQRKTTVLGGCEA